MKLITNLIVFALIIALTLVVAMIIGIAWNATLRTNTNAISKQLCIFKSLELENKNERDQNQVDFLIVGGGISGAYLARRLKQFYPNRSILLIERGVQMGGRLVDIQVPNCEIGLPLGGMRIFPAVQTLAASLVKQLGLETVSLPYVPGTNFAYLRGIRERIESLPSAAKFLYNLAPSERNKTADELVSTVINDFLKNQNITLDEIWSTPAVYNKNFWRLLFGSLSNEALQYYKNTSGYNMFIDDINAASGIQENVGIAPSPDSPQYFVKGGLSSIVKSLAKNFNVIDKGQKNNRVHQDRVNVLLSTELVNLDPYSDHVRATIQPILPTNINDTVPNIKSRIGPPIRINAKNLIFTGQPGDLRAIMSTLGTNNGPALDTMQLIDDSFISWGGSKIFIEFESEWWQELGLDISIGRSITDLASRQWWRWPAPNTMMMYSDMISTHYWRELLPSEPFPTWHSANQVPTLVAEIQKQVSLVFGVEQKYLGIRRVIWKAWIPGGSLWRPGNVLASSKKFSRPLGTKVPMFACNSDYSTWQIWIEGALTYADQLLTSQFNLPSLKNQSIV